MLLCIYVQVTRTGGGRMEGIGLLAQGDQSENANETRREKKNVGHTEASYLLIVRIKQTLTLKTTSAIWSSFS